MKKLILNIIFIGIFLGCIGSVTVMLLGLIVYYALKAADVIMLSFFLEKVAVAAVIAGIIAMFGWYGYILFTARKYFFEFLYKKEKK